MKRVRRPLPGLSLHHPRQRGKAFPGTLVPFSFLSATGPQSSLRHQILHSGSTQQAHWHQGAVTKECFLFQMNLHILIEGRCLELIQCSKLGLSI